MCSFKKKIFEKQFVCFCCRGLLGRTVRQCRGCVFWTGKCHELPLTLRPQKVGMRERHGLRPTHGRKGHPPRTFPPPLKLSPRRGGAHRVSGAVVWMQRRYACWLVPLLSLFIPLEHKPLWGSPSSGETALTGVGRGYAKPSCFHYYLCDKFAGEHPYIVII